MLLILLPLIARGWSTGFTLAALALPAYMLHQYEEHDADRFRRFVNDTIGGGREVLSLRAVFLVNIPGVWGVIALGLWLGLWQPGFALLGAWLMLVNAALHIVQGIVLRRYNPGLATAIVVFLPLGAAALCALPAPAGVQLIDLAVVLALHAAIILHVRARLRRG